MPDLESWRSYQDMPQVEAKPQVVLYDAKGQPLRRAVGFQTKRIVEPTTPRPEAGTGG